MKLEVNAKIIISCVAPRNSEDVRVNAILSTEMFLNSLQAFKANIPVDNILPLIGVRFHFDSNSCERAVKGIHETEAEKDR